MDVTVVTHRVGPVGGMEQALSELIGGLLGHGHEVTVVARECKLPPHPRLHWARVPCPARPFLVLYPWFLIAGSFTTWIRRRGILHTTGALVLNRADLSTVHFCHHALQAKTTALRTSRSGLPYRINAWLAARLSRWMERWSYRPSRTRRLVAVSNGVAGELTHHFPAMASAVRVIPNGVDRDVYRPDPELRERTRRGLGWGPQDLVALFVGGEWERKGLGFALDAVGATLEWRLLVVGRGDVERYARLADEKAPGRVHFAGQQTNTVPFYAAADVLVAPSAYEAFPLSLLEAAACGLPLLVTRISGAEDLVVDGENGWFVERDGASIAARLSLLGADEELRRRMAERVRETTRAFTWERGVDAYVDLYNSMSATPEA